MSYSGQTTGLKATKVFIVRDDYTTQADIKALVDSGAEGELGIHLEDSANIVTAALTEGNRFRIIQKRADDIHTSGIFPFQVGSAYCVDYKAGQKKIMSVKVNVPATKKDQVFIVRLYDFTESTSINYIESYDFTSVTGSETAAQIAAKIKQDFDVKETKKQVSGFGEPTRFTMTVSGDTLSISTIDPQTIFGVNTQADLEGNATITTTQEFLAENAGYDYVSTLEFEGQNFDGYLHAAMVNRFDNWGQMPKWAELGCTYDLIYIQPVIREKGMSLPFRENVHLPMIAIACKTATAGTSGSPVYTSLKTIFGL